MKFRYFKYNKYRQIILYLLLILPPIFIYDGIIVTHSVIELVLSITAEAIVISVLIFQYLSTVTIDSKGVKHSSVFREYLLTWEMIGQIKVISRWNGKYLWIIILKSDNPKQLHLKRNTYNRYMECITFAFSSEPLKAIIKYRGKEDYFESNLLGHHMYEKLGKF